MAINGSRLGRTVLMVVVTFAPGTLAHAQGSATGDSVAEAQQHLPLSAALAAGTVSFPGGRTEQATALATRARLAEWLTVGATPSFVRATEPSAASGGVAQHRSGLADLPISLEVAHEFSSAMSPALGVEFTATLPVGDTASGIGTGAVSYALGGSAGFSPASRLHLSGSAEHALSGFSVQGLLNGTASSWGDVSIGTPLGSGGTSEVSAGFESDLGSVDPTLGRSQSVSAALSWGVPWIGDLSITAIHGISGVAPTWSLALRVGRGWVGLGSMERSTAAAAQAFGAGAHGMPSAGNSGTAFGHSRVKKHA